MNYNRKYKRFESNGYMAILTPVIFRQNASPELSDVNNTPSEATCQTKT